MLFDTIGGLFCKEAKCKNKIQSRVCNTWPPGIGITTDTYFTVLPASF